MSKLYDDELDDTFRKGLEGKSLDPPPMVWNNIKHVALEHQLINVQTSTLWLKGLVGTLVVAIGGLGYLTYNQSKQIAELQKAPKTITITKTDTVFVQNQNASSIAQTPTIVYLERAGNESIEGKNIDNEIEHSEKQSNRNDETNELGTNNSVTQNSPNETRTTNNGNETASEVENSVADVERNIVAKNERVVSTKKNRMNKGTKAAKISGNISTENKEIFDENNERSAFSKVAKNQVSRNRIVKGKTDNNKSEATNYVEPSKNIANIGSENNSILNANIEASEIRTVETAEVLKLEPLATLPPTFETTLAGSSENVVMPKAVRAAVTRKPKSQMNWDWLDNFSVSTFVSPQRNEAIILRDEQAAFDYSGQHLSGSIGKGLRLGHKLNKAWSVQLGITNDLLRFEQDIDRSVVSQPNPQPQGDKKRQEIKTENRNGKDQFVFRSAIGTVEIPTGQFGRNPKPGETINVEMESTQNVQMLYVPLSFKYDFLQKNWQKYSLNMYAMAGPTFSIPYKQSAAVTIELPNGARLKETLTNFSNLRNSWGINAAFGAELGYGYHARLFIEPSVNQGITSIVKNMPVRTVIGGYGVKFGLKWQFGKY